MKHLINSLLVAVVLMPAINVRQAQLEAKVSSFLPAIQATIKTASDSGKFNARLPMPNVNWRDLDNIKAYLKVKGYSVQDNGQFYDNQALVVGW